MDDKALSFLMFRAMRGVIRSAENGDLPLFARTLGLPLEQYRAMLAHFFPEYPAADEVLPPSYWLLQANMPDDFPLVLSQIVSLRMEADQQPATLWLAHAVASAAYGEQALWESMELASVQQLQMLLARTLPKLSLLKYGLDSWQTSLFAREQ